MPSYVRQLASYLAEFGWERGVVGVKFGWAMWTCSYVWRIRENGQHYGRATQFQFYCRTYLISSLGLDEAFLAKQRYNAGQTVVETVLLSPPVLILKEAPNLPSLEKSLGINRKFRQRCGLWATIFYCWIRRQGWWLCCKKAKFWLKSDPEEQHLWRREFTSAIYHEFS